MSGSRIEDGPGLGPLEPMGVEVEHGEGRGTVRLTGELDLGSGAEAERAFRSAEELGEPLVVLDLRELEFMDSAGVHVIVEASARAAGDGRRLTVLRGPGHVGAIFELTRTDSVVELADLDGH